MKKIIILISTIILLSGCSSKKCIKSHEEKAKCVIYSYIKTGDVQMMVPHYYDCTKTICDEYEEVSE